MEPVEARFPGADVGDSSSPDPFAPLLLVLGASSCSFYSQRLSSSELGMSGNLGALGTVLNSFSVEWLGCNPGGEKDSPDPGLAEKGVP